MRREVAKAEIQNSISPSSTTGHRLAGLILISFVALAIGYSLVTPPLEAGDESRHYAVVKYMADTGRLPVQQPGEAQIHWSHEGNQPPLYYALAAALTFWIDTGTWNEVFWYNPHTTIGNPLRPDNKNITIHPPGEAWPWRGHVLAVHLIRFLSIAMAAVTVTTAYAIALNLFKGNRRLAAGAMAITAFNPMFIFISASVNNDNAVIMFVTLALWLMGQVTGPPYPGPITNSLLKFAALLGLLIGLGALSKLYALGLLPLTGLLFIWRAYQDNHDAHRPARFAYHVVTWTLTTGLVVAGVAGWFYLRNALLYHGDVLALQTMRETAGQRTTFPTLATLRAEFEGFRIAYWALFGGVNILAANWIYQALDWVSLIAALGVVGFIIYDLCPPKYLRHGPFTAFAHKGPPSKISPSQTPGPLFPISRPTFYLLLGWYLVMLTGFIAWNITQPAGQGRLLYPAIGAISALGMWGVTWWLPAKGQPVVIALVAIGLFLFAAWSPVLYIAPAYTKPPVLAATDLPAEMQPVNFTYDGKLRLLGYQLDSHPVHPAETLPLTLYWQMLEPVKLNYSIFIHLMGRQRHVVGQVDTYPGNGHWPTTLLSPGDILADHYEIPIQPEAELDQAPTRLLIAAGIYDFNEPGRPGKPAADSTGQPVEPIIAQAKLIPWQWPAPPRLEAPIIFADKITLLSYSIAPNQGSVTLNWQANTLPDTDYTVFLQLWQTDSLSKPKQVAGFDGPPVQGDYPTSLWAPGEIVVDIHPLDLSSYPPGDYYLLAGLYHPTTGERLPAWANGQPLPDYAVNLGVIKIAD